jgi:CRP/FNR family transcriptional regulator, cyclic AMP receptor protein
MSNKTFDPVSVITTILRKVPLFSRLDDAELVALAAMGATRRYRKDEMIFLRGDEGTQLYVILQGRVRIFVEDERGREVTLKVIEAEDFFGEMALLDGQERSASVQAGCETRAFVLSREGFSRFLNQTPAVAMRLLASLSQRIRHADEAIENLALLSVKGRLARLLVSWAARISGGADGPVELKLPMPKSEIAKMLGTSRETVSRLMSEMSDEGAFATVGQSLHIESLAALRAIP